MNVKTWRNANNLFGEAISDVRKHETRQDGIDKFKAILSFIEQEECCPDIDHNNRIATLHILLNKCIVSNALPIGENDFQEHHKTCNEDVARLNRLLLGKPLAPENFLYNSLSETYKKYSLFHELTPDVLWTIGRLNYRLHNFDEAKLFLHEATKGVNEKDKFKVFALLAYACEFSGHPWEAIRVLLGEDNPIFCLPFCTKLGGYVEQPGYCSCRRGSEEATHKCNNHKEKSFEEVSDLFDPNNTNVKKDISPLKLPQVRPIPHR